MSRPGAQASSTADLYSRVPLAAWRVIVDPGKQDRVAAIWGHCTKPNGFTEGGGVTCPRASNREAGRLRYCFTKSLKRHLHRPRRAECAGHRRTAAAVRQDTRCAQHLDSHPLAALATSLRAGPHMSARNTRAAAGSSCTTRSTTRIYKILYNFFNIYQSPFRVPSGALFPTSPSGAPLCTAAARRPSLH